MNLTILSSAKIKNKFHTSPGSQRYVKFDTIFFKTLENFIANPLENVKPYVR